MKEEPIYAVTYTESVSYDDGYGDMATSRFNVFKQFGNFKEFEDWVIGNQQKHPDFKSFIVEPISVTRHVHVEVQRK